MWKVKKNINLYKIEDKLIKKMNDYINRHYIQNNSENFLSPNEMKQGIKNRIISLSDTDLIKYEKQLETPNNMFNSLIKNMEYE